MKDIFNCQITIQGKRNANKQTTERIPDSIGKRVEKVHDEKWRPLRLNNRGGASAGSFLVWFISGSRQAVIHLLPVLPILQMHLIIL